MAGEEPGDRRIRRVSGRDLARVSGRSRRASVADPPANPGAREGVEATRRSQPELGEHTFCPSLARCLQQPTGWTDVGTGARLRADSRDGQGDGGWVLQSVMVQELSARRGPPYSALPGGAQPRAPLRVLPRTPPRAGLSGPGGEIPSGVRGKEEVLLPACPLLDAKEDRKLPWARRTLPSGCGRRGRRGRRGKAWGVTPHPPSRRKGCRSSGGLEPHVG
mmetsp:Transcript_30390/g.62638  ORF Transcript_30390/g.62638 Transcript_30390/m.62638 type:complete len:220 (+) Transcript_30390:583-1242(+)